MLNRAPLTIVVVFLSIVISQSAVAVDPIDASVIEVGVKDKNLFTNKSVSILTADYEAISLTLEKHQQTAVCRWSFPQPQGQPVTAVAQDRLIFWIDFFLDNKPFSQERWNLEKGENFGRKIFTDASNNMPLSAGKHALSCKVSFNYATPGEQPEDPNPTNNQKTARLFAANNAWDPLFPEEIPEVYVKVDPPFANITPDLELELTPIAGGLPIRGSTFFDYAHGTKSKEEIHYRITRVVSGKEIAVGETLREISNAYSLSNRTILRPDWFSKHGVGAGDYRVRAFFTQATDSGIVTGPMTKDATEFTLAELKLVDRPPTTPIGGSDGQPTAADSAAERQRPALAQPIGSQPLPDPTNPRGSGLAAPPSPCSMEVTYYVPQPPIIEASASTVEVGDQLRIRCDYTSVTETIEWPVCDDRARNKMASLARSQTSGSRYSGVLTIDGLNMGVTTSPPDLSSFSGKGTMMYRDVGSHEVGCQIDNGLNYVVENTETYLRQVVSHKAGALTELDRIRRFDPANVVQITTELLQAQISPLPDGALARINSQTSARGSATASGGSSDARGGFDPKQTYSQVRTEEGDVIKDADWNTPGQSDAMPAEDVRAMPTAEVLGGGAAVSVVPETLEANPIVIGETHARPIDTNSVELICTSRLVKTTPNRNEYLVSVQNPTAVSVRPGILALKMLWMNEDGVTGFLRGLTTTLDSDLQPDQVVELDRKVIIKKEQNVRKASTCLAYLRYPVDP